jgi:hypothetical protein
MEISILLTMICRFRSTATHHADAYGDRRGTNPATHAGRDTGARARVLSGMVQHAVGLTLGSDEEKG